MTLILVMVMLMMMITCTVSVLKKKKTSYICDLGLIRRHRNIHKEHD